MIHHPFSLPVCCIASIEDRGMYLLWPRGPHSDVQIDSGQAIVSGKGTKMRSVVQHLKVPHPSSDVALHKHPLLHKLSCLKELKQGSAASAGLSDFQSSSEVCKHPEWAKSESKRSTTINPWIFAT